MAKSKNNLDISVLIATYNRAEILLRTLESITVLERTGLSVEFVVVDNNSSDHTKQVIESFTERLPVRYLFEPNPGQNCARNRALEDVELGRLVVFTDDDVEPGKDWLKAIVSISERWPEYSVFGGKIYVVWPNIRIPEWAHIPHVKSLCFAEHNYAESKCVYAPRQYPFSGNFWVRRDLLANGRRFDERIGPRPGGYIMGSESSFLQKLSEDGYRMVYSPEAVVGHRVLRQQISIGNVLRRAYRRGRAIAHNRPLCRQALLDNHPVLWRLVQAGAIVRLTFSMLTSLAALILKKPGKAMRTMRLIGYNVESLNIANKYKLT